MINHFVSGFVWANALILAISLAGGLGHVTLGGLNSDNPTVFKLQITQNVFMAFAALIWLSRTFEYKGLLRWGYAGLVLLATFNVLLMVQGRTGYVALAAGMGTWLLLTLRRKQLIAVLACGTLAIAMLVMTPNRAMERLTLGYSKFRGAFSPRPKRLMRPATTPWGNAPPSPGKPFV